MAIDLPRNENLPSGDLARAVNHEQDSEWPAMIEIVAYFGPHGRKGKRRAITISADQYYGRKGFNAPITGDNLILMIEKLRKSG